MTVRFHYNRCSGISIINWSKFSTNRIFDLWKKTSFACFWGWDSRVSSCYWLWHVLLLTPESTRVFASLHGVQRYTAWRSARTFSNQQYWGIQYIGVTEDDKDNMASCFYQHCCSTGHRCCSTENQHKQHAPPQLHFATVCICQNQRNGHSAVDAAPGLKIWCSQHLPLRLNHSRIDAMGTLTLVTTCSLYTCSHVCPQVDLICRNKKALLWHRKRIFS